MAADLQTLVKRWRDEIAEYDGQDDGNSPEDLMAGRRQCLQELEAAADRIVEAAADDDGCVCRGNWRLIVKEEESRIGQKFNDASGDVWTFFGVVWADDDFYYGMCRQGRTMLLTCCGSIEAGGYTPVLTDAALAQARRTDRE